MISRIKGELAGLTENSAEIRVNELTYEILLPAYVEGELRGKTGQEIELYVHHYLEGNPGGAALLPRLVGFTGPEDKAFYSLLVKVPGLGSRSALKAMTVPPGEIARAIEQEDKTSLSKLPGLGKRTADKVIATLKGKVAVYATGAPAGKAESGGAPIGEDEEEAVLVLMQLGYKLPEAERLVRKTRAKHPGMDDPEKLVQAALKEAGSGAMR